MPISLRGYACRWHVCVVKQVRETLYELLLALGYMARKSLNFRLSSTHHLGLSRVKIERIIFFYSHDQASCKVLGLKTKLLSAHFEGRLSIYGQIARDDRRETASCVGDNTQRLLLTAQQATCTVATHTVIANSLFVSLCWLKCLLHFFRFIEK
jgi:hypothetical protein